MFIILPQDSRKSSEGAKFPLHHAADDQRRPAISGNFQLSIQRPPLGLAFFFLQIHTVSFHLHLASELCRLTLLDQAGF